jgi:hypothetical protein
MFLQGRLGTAATSSAVICLDSDDVEDFLVEEGIGHFNRSGNFEYGPYFDFEDVCFEVQSPMKKDGRGERNLGPSNQEGQEKV